MIQSSHRHRQLPPTLVLSLQSLQGCYRLPRALAQGGPVHPQPRHPWHLRLYPVGCLLFPRLRPPLSPMVHHSFPTLERSFSRNLVGLLLFLLHPSQNLRIVRANRPGGMSSKVRVPLALGLLPTCRVSFRPLLRLLKVRSCDFQ